MSLAPTPTTRVSLCPHHWDSHTHTPLPCLGQLNLSSNSLRDRAIVALTKGIEGNSSLQALDLSYNLWEDSGAAALGRALVCSWCCSSFPLPPSPSLSLHLTHAPRLNGR